MSQDQNKQAKYRNRKQVVSDCLEKGAITETEALALNKAINQSNASFERGKMYIDLRKYNDFFTKDLEKRIEKNDLTPIQKKTLHTIRVANIKKPQLIHPAEVDKACQNYINIMIEDGMSPTISGIALAIGISTAKIREIINGNEKSPSADVIKMYAQMIDVSNEVAIRNGGVVGEMFMAKNYHNMSDKQDITIKHDKVEMTDAELAEHYNSVDIIDIEPIDNEEK